MKKSLFFLIILFAYTCAHAGITTYQFTSLQWASQVGATKCDGKTDGWVCDQQASEYMTGRTDAQGRLYSQGVSVKTGTSGAGATSVLSFTEVRRIDFNFCQNSSKGRGVIYVQVGSNPYDSIVINKPATSGSGVYLRDSIVHLETPQTGKIRFWITCTENAINLNSISIRAKEGGSNPFTQPSFQLVTNADQLHDNDLVIFGIADGVTDKIMGYYDPAVSKNNIHAVKARYAKNRTEVEPNMEMAYLFHELPIPGGPTSVWTIEDIGYGGLYLVADGGRTKNKLTLWDKVDSPSYGAFGYWDINIATNGEATLTNQGSSERKYLQYNAADQLFGCYGDANSQTKVALYRYTEAQGTDDPAIVAPFVNFGNMRLINSGNSGNSGVSGVRTILVNGNKLTEAITVRLAKGEIFAVDATELDQDGDLLTISFTASEEGVYQDTIILTSTGVTHQVPVMVHVIAVKTVAEAVQAKDFETIFLGDVIVTKKYDKYIFVRDETGSMLIYDTENPNTGKPYGQGLENGHVLSNVQGRFKNYFGLPEITPTAVWSVGSQKEECLPEVVEKVDSSDVCRYVTVIPGEDITIEDAFNTGIDVDRTQPLDAIVMWAHDALELWPIKQEPTTSLQSAGRLYSPTPLLPKKIFHNGQILIEYNHQYYPLLPYPSTPLPLYSQNENPHHQQ